MLLSLANRIRLLVLAICAGLALSVLLAFQVLANRNVERTLKHDAENVSGILTNVVQGRRKLLASLTRFVATSPRTRELALTDEATVKAIVEGLRKDVGVDALVITDQDGKLLGQAGFASALSFSAKNPEFGSALHDKAWSGIGERAGSLQIIASEPLKIGEFVQGSVAAYISLGSKSTQDLTNRGAFELAFLHDGHLIQSSISNLHLKVPADQTSWTVDTFDRQYVAQRSVLPGTTRAEKYEFVVLRPRDELLSLFQEFRIAFVSVLVLLSMIALGLGSSVASRVVKSLDGLIAAAEKLRKGEWPEHLRVSHQPEIGLLQSTFNEMTTSLRASQERLLAMIDIDPLTELYNHRKFKDQLQHEAIRTAASHEPLTLMILDIDDFKGFNELHGSARGDELLCEVSEVLKEIAPETASLARYGGGEFAVILPDGLEMEAQALYSQVRARVTSVTLSAGCAQFAEARDKISGLVTACELALGQAKNLGRARFCSYDSMHSDEDGLKLSQFIEDGTYATIRALAAAVDAKDPYTHGHSDRVARYAADLAAYLGASASEVELVLRSGTLHDVGKIGVPDAILKKPGRLDDDEFKMMQAHPVLGELIVNKVPQLHDLLPGVRFHHERYDGKGYPDGLAGENIPRLARFLAVADTYDAMTSDRPYRKGLDQAIALAEIEKGAGTQFDPIFARAFAEMMRENQIHLAA